MYGYDYELAPANEGIRVAFAHFWKLVWNGIQEAAKFLKFSINNLGKMIKLKMKKSDVTAADNKAKQLIADIGSKTEAIIIECSKGINTMYEDYAEVGNVEIGETNDRPDDVSPTDKVHVAVTDPKSGKFQHRYFDPAGKMEKSGSTSSSKWNKFQERFGKVFTSMHADAEEIKKKLTELGDMPVLSYKATVEGYNQLKSLYDANGKFGKEWTQLKTAHEFANEGPIKKALGKIVSMYNVGINAAKAFANRLKVKADKPTDANPIDSNDEFRGWDAYRDKNGTFTRGEMKSRIESQDKSSGKKSDLFGAYSKDKGSDKKSDNERTKTEESNESVMLTRLYDMAYEDAMHDFEMKAEYIKAFESVPDAFEMKDD